MNLFSVTRRRVIIALGSGLLLLGIAGSVFAAPPTPPPNPGDSDQATPWYGCWGATTGMPMVGALQDAAKLLGLTPQDLQSQLQSGKSLAAIAQEKGASTDKLAATILATSQSYLDAQVKSGALTQQQADQMLQTMKTNINTMIQWSGGFGPGMMGGAWNGGYGGGMMGGAWNGGYGGGMMGGAWNGGHGSGMMGGI